jgi:hypothetical protein
VTVRGEVMRSWSLLPCGHGPSRKAATILRRLSRGARAVGPLFGDTPISPGLKR